METYQTMNNPTPPINTKDDKGIFKYWKDYKKYLVAQNAEAKRLNNIEGERISKLNYEYIKDYEEKVKEWQDRKASYIKKNGHNKQLPWTLAYGRPVGPISIWLIPIAFEESISFDGYVRWLDKHKKI